jgi:hypothetical protein
MAKLSLGAKLVLASGVAGAGTAAVVASALFFNAELNSSPSAASATTAADAATITLDYNCNLPGKGYPWLRQDLSFTVQGTSSAVFVSTVAGVSPWAGFLPVPVNADGTAQSMDDVYRRLCLVNSQLGGSGLTRLSPGEAQQLIMGGTDRCLERDWADSPDLYSDQNPLAVDEARICLEPVRVYWLPPLPQDLLNALAEDDEVIKQRWGVTLSGHEIHDLNPWTLGLPGRRQGVRFDWSVDGEFTVRKRMGQWSFLGGKAKGGSIGLETLYEPIEAWRLKETTPHCLDCDREFPALGSPVAGVIETQGGETFVTLDWGAFAPSAEVRAWDDQKEDWVSYFHTSWEFIREANTVGFTLLEGPTGTTAWRQPIEGEGSFVSGSVRYSLRLLEEE